MPPPPPTACRRRAGAVFVTCSRHVVNQLYVARFMSNETRQRQSKSVFVNNFVKMKNDAKSFVWNFFGSLVNKADDTVKDFNSVYCTV